MVDSVNHQAEPDAADFREAARLLRAILDALPPTTARDRAAARRIEGAAVTLETLTRLCR